LLILVLLLFLMLIFPLFLLIGSKIVDDYFAGLASLLSLMNGRCSSQCPVPSTLLYLNRAYIWSR
jgi:hypothetical protein